MNDRNQFRAKCPFFRARAAMSITCEWMASADIRMLFFAKERADIYFDKYCCDCWEKCPHGQLYTRKLAQDEQNRPP